MKTKQRKFKALLMMLVMTVSLLGNAMIVFAASAGSNSTISAYIAANGENMASSVKGYFTEYADVNAINAAGKGADYRYYTCTKSNGTTVYFVIEANQEATAEGVINKLSASQNTNKQVDDILGGLDIKADTGSASNLVKGLEKPLATFLGGLTIILTAGMTFFTGLDLAYIAFPVFREKCDDKKQSGGIGTKQDSKTGNTKLTFITDDAQHAVIAADTVQSGKSPFIIYLKGRMLAFILLSVVIFIFLTGNIGIFAKLALSLVQGVLDFISGF